MLFCSLFQIFMTSLTNCPDYLIRKAEVWALYATWNDILTNKSKFSVDFYDRDSWHSASKIKDLIYNHKDAYFKSFFSDDQNRAIVKGQLQYLESFQLFPGEIEKELEKDIENLRRTISNMERRLINSPHWIAHYGSNVLRLFTHNPYALGADFLVDSQDKVLQSAQLGPFSAPLDPPFRKFAKILTACGLFSLDLMQWRWIGFSHNMLTAITHQWMPRAKIWIKAFRHFNRDEKTAMAYLPFIHHLFELTTFIGMNLYFYGPSFQSITHLTGAYYLALGTSYCSAKIIDIFYRAIYKDRPLQDIATYPLVYGIAQWVTFPLTINYALPFLSKYFRFPPENILVDKETCFAHQDLCKKEARKVLGLEEHATIGEVRAAFRDLAFKYHPDKDSSGAEIFQKITQARDFCLALQKIDL